jgi:hypothetical protein
MLMKSDRDESEKENDPHHNDGDECLPTPCYLNERGEDYQEQIGMPDEENMRSWSHHHSTDTVDDPIFRAAMRGYDAVSFVFGLEVTWSLIQQRQQDEEERQAMLELESMKEMNEELDMKDHAIKDDGDDEDINVEDDEDDDKDERDDLNQDGDALQKETRCDDAEDVIDVETNNTTETENESSSFKDRSKSDAIIDLFADASCAKHDDAQGLAGETNDSEKHEQASPAPDEKAPASQSSQWTCEVSILMAAWLISLHLCGTDHNLFFHVN